MSISSVPSAGGDVDGGKKRWIIIVLVILIVLAPIVAIGGSAGMVLVLMASAAGGGGGQCTADSGSVGGLEVEVQGRKISLGAKQMQNAATIVAVGRQLDVPAQGQVVALMTALQESKLWVYANTVKYPESANIPHDQDGKDHDSLGVFQQRPSSGWGSVAETMDVEYSAKAFFGGSKGPNHGSPQGLLDIKGWEGMSLTQAAQAVQVSAFPNAYAPWETAARAILAAVSDSVSCGGADAGTAVLPLDPGYTITSGYGPRPVTIQGASGWHPAIDMQNRPGPCGKPVYAVFAGKVTLSSQLWLTIESADGTKVSYLHMFKSDRVVNVGDTVTAGQRIGSVGNVAPSSGCHLDLRINVSNSTNEQAKALPRAESRGGPEGFVNPADFLRLYGLELCPAGSGNLCRG